MIEDEIDGVVLPLDLEAVLAADKRESGAELGQEFPQVPEEPPVDFARMCLVPQPQEIEVVGVLQNLLGQLGPGTREGSARSS